VSVTRCVQEHYVLFVSQTMLHTRACSVALSNHTASMCQYDQILQGGRRVAVTALAQHNNCMTTTSNKMRFAHTSRWAAQLSGAHEDGTSISRDTVSWHGGCGRLAGGARTHARTHMLVRATDEPGGGVLCSLRWPRGARRHRQHHHQHQHHPSLSLQEHSSCLANLNGALKWTLFRLRNGATTQTVRAVLAASVCVSADGTASATSSTKVSNCGQYTQAHSTASRRSLWPFEDDHRLS
jgi:hypothetical protein